MSEQSNFFKGMLPACVVMALVAGCAAPSGPAADKDQAQAVSCSAAQAGETLVGNWLAVRTQKGVAGELHVLFTLKPDGSMAYVEQLKRGRQPPRMLSETGCWTRSSQQLVLQTTESNGVPVDLNDPIYRNQYQITSAAADRLGLSGAAGTMIARRMPADYRLPVL